MTHFLKKVPKWEETPNKDALKDKQRRYSRGQKNNQTNATYVQIFFKMVLSTNLLFRF